MTITVLLVDDHPVVRTGLRAVLDTGSEVSIVAEAPAGRSTDLGRTFPTGCRAM